MDANPRVRQLLGEFVNHWTLWDRNESFYLDYLLPRLIASFPHTGGKVEKELLRELKAELAPDQWRRLPQLVREYRAETQDAQERDRYASQRQDLLPKLRERFEHDFLSAHDFYRSQCIPYVSEAAYKEEKRAYVQAWAKRHLASEPDPEQVRAIGAVERHVQVAARAGSGKTSTLINRALFLLKHCGVSPHEMLLLAFNKRAAEEMRERLERGVSGSIPHVMTFHALAYALVHPEEPILYDEPDGQQSKSRALQSLVDDYVRTDEGHEEIRALMMMHFREDWERIASGGYDKGRDDMMRYRRSLVNEGIDGTYVKSYGEKAIADFLFEHGIKYIYERNHWWNGTNYRPDFTVFTGKDRGIVIEYFGLQGDPDYDRLSERKRHHWRSQSDWELVALSPNDLRGAGIEGFRANLQWQLERHGVSCKRLSEDEIWALIKDRAIDRFTKVVVGFVQRCRKLALSPAQLTEKIGMYNCVNEIEERFLRLARIFYTSYLEYLEATGEEDFDGLLQQATARVRADQTVFRRRVAEGDLKRLRFVFIDEYQDFSELFHRLIEAIRAQNPHARFFCVGDDWQAINGFAGSDLRFYREFVALFQPAQRLHITTNYRSAMSIVQVSNALMSRFGTPARAYKTEAGAAAIADLGAFEPTPREEEEHSGDSLTPAVLRLVSEALATGKNVVLLSRTNRVPWFVNYGDRRSFSRAVSLPDFLKLVRGYLPQSERNKVSISTAHKYKGLEQPVVILLDAVNRCYPLIHPDWIFARILGDSIEQIVDEERRLFYVALTRAVDRLIILTEKDNQSPFVEDIREHSSIALLNWSDYRPLTRTNQRIAVKVGNQSGKESGGTYAIREMLKAEGYRWASTGWRHWWRTVPADGFSAEEFFDRALWSADADGIEVRFHDDADEQVAVYRVDKGQWTRVIDKTSSPAIGRRDTNWLL